MLKKTIFFIIILLMLTSTVFAGNNTTEVDHTTEYKTDLPTIKAIESGDSNISFQDNYKGYCIEWGEHSAEAGDEFYISDTSGLINKETHEDVSNHIKTFFVYFYKESQQNPIVTQHIIWKFTDNKEFSQFKANKELYNAILEKSSQTKVPDTGFLQVDNDTQMFFDFKIFISRFLEYQNYFGYNIFFKNITNINNIAINETTNQTIEPLINETIVQDKNSTTNSIVKNVTTSTSIYTMDKNKTGYEVWSLICAIFLVLLCISLRRK